MFAVQSKHERAAGGTRTRPGIGGAVETAKIRLNLRA